MVFPQYPWNQSLFSHIKMSVSFWDSMTLAKSQSPPEYLFIYLPKNRTFNNLLDNLKDFRKDEII